MLPNEFIEMIDPFDHFPAHVLDGQVDGRIKQLSIFAIANELAVFKNANHKLTDLEEEERDQLTFVAFALLKNAANSDNAGAQYFEFVRPVLPTRYARKFCQLCIKTGFALPTYSNALTNVGRALGWNHEVQALQYLQQAKAA